MFQTGITAEKAIVLYVHKDGRSGFIAEEFLKGYHGYLQKDDYSGYNGVEAQRVLCHVHVRRKSADIVKAKKGFGSVETVKEVMRRYQNIFHIDSEIRQKYGVDYKKIRKSEKKNCVQSWMSFSYTLTKQQEEHQKEVKYTKLSSMEELIE